MNDYFSGIDKDEDPFKRALYIQGVVCGAGFDWADHEGVLLKIVEETEEIRAELDAGCEAGVENEVGDLIFSVLNLCRRLSADPAECLEKTNRKFMRRFQYVAEGFRSLGMTLSPEHLPLMERLWEESKKETDEIMLDK